MASSPRPPSLPQHFFFDFWPLLIDIAKTVDREDIREKISGAYIYLLDFMTLQFLHQQKASMPKDTHFSSALNQSIMQFAKKYQWDSNNETTTLPSSLKVVTPYILDVMLQEYINYMQGLLPSDLDLLKDLPSHTNLPKARGKKYAGSFYTPPNLARFLAQKVISNYVQSDSTRSAKEISIIDPSMGSGIFLVESATILLQLLIKAFPDKPVRRHLVELLNNHLFGIDILPEAVYTAKKRLLLWAAAHISPRDLTPFIEEIDFKQHLLCIDALTIPVEKVFHAFGLKSFPLVVGNPPFLHTRTGLIDEKYKKKLKNMFADVTLGQWDLCTLFVRRVGDFLDPKGHWGFVLPTRLLSNEHYEPIRRWLIDKFHVSSLVDAGMAFSDAGVEVFLLIAGPHGNKDESVFFEKFDGEGSEKLGEMRITEVHRFPFSAIPWLPHEMLRNMILKMSEESGRLGDFVSITRGFECGFNDQTIGTQDQLILRGYPQTNLLPIIKGSNILPFHIVLSTPPTFCVPDWNLSGKFKTHALFTSVPKIVIRFVANDVIAAIDEIGYMNTNGVYNLHSLSPLQPEDLWWILALLNSIPVSIWFRSIFSNRDKLYPHIQKNQLDAIPIPSLNNLEKQVLEQISKIKCAGLLEQKENTVVDDQMLNPLCIALFLKDTALDELLITIERVLADAKIKGRLHSSERLDTLVAELKKRNESIFSTKINRI